MNNLVRIITDDDGIRKDKPVWCAVDPFGGGNRTLCSGEAFGYGESACQFDIKQHKRGITCKDCRDKIRFIKSIKL